MPLRRKPVATTVSGHNGIALNVWDYGGPGVPLILAHCTGTLGRIWDPVVEALEDKFRVLAPDTRGQGDSEAPATRDQYRWDYSGKDLLAVVKHFNLGTGVAAVGHSAGGAHVAYAAQMSPETFGKVMLIDAIIADRAYFEGENRLATMVAHRKNEFASKDAARERLASKPPMANWVERAIDAYLDHALEVGEDGTCQLKCPGTREAWYYELGGASDLYDTLDALELNACLVTGEDSYAQNWVAEQEKRLQQVCVETVAGAGHFIPQEKPAETAALITQWFRD